MMLNVDEKFTSDQKIAQKNSRVAFGWREHAESNQRIRIQVADTIIAIESLNPIERRRAVSPAIHDNATIQESVICRRWLCPAIHWAAGCT